MMIPGETVHSFLPQDIPWFAADYFVFFSITYTVLLLIVLGLGCCFIKALWDSLK